MTTRKTPQGSGRGCRAYLGLLAGMLGLGLGGCATPGNLHVYSLAATDLTQVRNTAATEAGQAEERDAPSFLGEDTLTGFGYDPYTDHFFLRLAPGNQIRVVDRPDRSIKREFTVAEMPVTGGGDLAVKPRNGHIFLVHPTEPALIELTRLAGFVRVIRLAEMSGPPTGVAYDAGRDVLLVLAGKAGTGAQAEAGAQVVTYALEGRRLGTITLEREVAGSLAFDAEMREFYAPLLPTGTGASATAGAGIGVFDETGKLKRTLRSEAAFVDVGQRSLIRMF